MRSLSSGFAVTILLLFSAVGFAAQALRGSITFDNQSGEPALVKLVGPTTQAVEVPNGEKRTVNVAAGEYYLLARYGADPKRYIYSRGDPFKVEETATRYSVITITLHKVVGGNYPTHPTSAEEFDRAFAGSKEPQVSKESPSGTQEVAQKKLVGEWKGIDHRGEITSIFLEENGQAKFILGTVVLQGGWKLDASRIPIELDLTVQRPSTETATIPMIVRFLTENKIQLRMGDNMLSRPIGFSAEDERNQIVLERQSGKEHPSGTQEMAQKKPVSIDAPAAGVPQHPSVSAKDALLQNLKDENLRRNLNDENADVRRAAAEALGQIAMKAMKEGDADRFMNLLGFLFLVWLDDRYRNLEIAAEIVAGAYRFFILLGQPGTVSALTGALNKHGTVAMATDFVNSGNYLLEEAARAWARRHGYTVTQSPDVVGGPRWGSGRAVK